MSGVDIMENGASSFGFPRGENCTEEYSLEVVPRLIQLVTASGNPEVDIRGGDGVRLDDSNVSELVGAILVNNGNSPVTSLSLKYNHITDIGTKDIVRLVENEGSCLRALDLEGNDIGAGGAAVIGDALAADDCRLRELTLSWNNLSTEGGQSIASSLSANSSLRVLKVANCGLSYAPLIALYTAVKKHPHLEELDVDRPIFGKYDGDICADHLSVALLNHPTMQKLSARYQVISDYGASLISRSLMSRVNIRSINLSCNCIGVEGAEHLASFVVQSRCIEELNLASNHIADEGALAMSKAIRASNCLKVLVLQNNSIRVTGLTAIGRALEKNNTLQKIFLWGNVFDDSAGRLYHELGANRFPYTGLRLDFTTYVVDGVHHVAELSE